MNSKIALPSLVLVGALVLSGCTVSGSSTSEPDDRDEPGIAEPSFAPEPTSEPEPAPEPDDMILAFGEAMTWEDGVSLSVSAPGAFTAGEYAAGVVPGQAQIVFTIVITNGSSEVLDPLAYGTLSSGGQEASAIFDSGNPAGDIGMSPTTAILPGQTVQWLEAYSVVDPASLTFQIAPSFAYEDAIFTNIQ